MASTLTGDVEEPLVESGTCNVFGLVLRNPAQTQVPPDKVAHGDCSRFP